MKKLAFISILCLCFILLVSCNSADEPIDIFTDESRPLPSPEEQIASCDHHLGEWKTVGADNCITEGVKTRKCKFCPYEESESVFGEHSFVSGKCEFCDRRAPSEGFRFEKDNSNNGYIAFITKDVTDEIVSFPDEHLGKPITRIDTQSDSVLENVREIYIPASVVYIESGAFAHMTNLSAVHIEEESKLTRISTGAFRDCTSLVSVSFENCTRLNSIGGGVFKGCSKLKKIEFADTVKEIGNGTFADCVSLENINFMNKFTVISDSMFAGCTGLKNIRIPDSVTEIQDYAFSDSGLEHVALPQSLETIGKYAFRDCESLQIVEFNGSISAISEGMFYGCVSLMEVSGNVVIFRIEKNAFVNCAKLTTLGLRISYEVYVGENAFAGCDSLENIP